MPSFHVLSPNQCTASLQVADTPEFVSEIDRATGVWFGGGRQWRIANAYLGTAAQLAFERVLDRGGVIGGSSAGAAFQGDVMIRGNQFPNDLSILLDPDHLQGFGYATGKASLPWSQASRTPSDGWNWFAHLQVLVSIRTTFREVGWTTTSSSGSCFRRCLESV
eukprot:SAG31_NODE_95_length_25901_cov_24.763700_5_plen_164_part_00